MLKRISMTRGTCDDGLAGRGMIALLQRVAQARVLIDGQTIGEIAAGLLVLLCAERGDSELESDKMLAKIIKLRIFGDAISARRLGRRRRGRRRRDLHRVGVVRHCRALDLDRGRCFEPRPRARRVHHRRRRLVLCRALLACVRIASVPADSFRRSRPVSLMNASSRDAASV